MVNPPVATAKLVDAGTVPRGATDIRQATGVLQPRLALQVGRAEPVMDEQSPGNTRDFNGISMGF